ncbi:biotin--[acetyl-CoA-carboxylase] ligase [Heliophilum fasciatum]|uniref:Bifunctional ligase/repressor BirA n=1 Tax=Heliophilum fasciatum TaxID=35700 RepID=A0A4R2RY11_9FIRM|nr:biotin--[acetyl-CoA-carboxylase] ligase [Heliophilum fasciatum]MCW2277076.1 BirA family biotin operon repressor/biotin-[acetyl-CoA-carboxylase] ligase [Heliophilum fasciatum]TCP68398.1 BirA family biotin operon repressor/biotin-[acetyl-CoA-carboxylase] ligase [Heliophilum fasciatum]
MARTQILAAIKNAPSYISGEELSRQLQISRSAVWKHVVALRQEGYEIEAHTRLGYRLRSASPRLLASEVLPRLTTKRLGQNYHFFASLPSTNRTAKELARQGAPEGTLVVAEEQTAGRGRLGRAWVSPRNCGIYLSLVLRPAVPLGMAAQVTLLTSVSYCRAIEQVTGLKPMIKWPNDVLLSGKKICGILTEVHAEMEAVNYLIVGIGMNVNHQGADFPEEVRPVATSLALEAGKTVDSTQLLLAFLACLEADYDRWLSDGFGSIREQWLARAAGLGRPVQIVAGQRQWQGRLASIDEEGALLVTDTDGATHRVYSGEVSIRPEGGTGYDFGD